MEAEKETQLIEYYENQQEVTSVETWQASGCWHVVMRNVADHEVYYRSDDLEEALSQAYTKTCFFLPEWKEHKQSSARAAVIWLRRVRDITKDQRVENAQVKTSKRGKFRARMMMGSIVGKGQKYVPTVDEAIKQAHADCLATISQMRSTLEGLGEFDGDC